VKEIKAGKFEILDDPEETIVSIIPPTLVKEAVAAEGEEAAPEAAPEVEGAAEPEVISEKKAEERQAEKKKE
jgi:hypothetical protein